MVNAALEGLQEVKNPGADTEILKRTGGRMRPEQKLFEVWDALAKYFNLSFGEDQYIDPINEVYKKIKIGLSAPYEIVIFHPASKKHGKEMTGTVGFVSPKKGAALDVRAAGPIRQLFVLS
jgi:hypothetical protein